MTVFPQDKEYFGALDTLRFLAFLCVFISHIFVFSTFQFSGLKTRWIITYLLTQGNLGVSFFFVLSGFLITYLLLKEINRKGEISVAHFYIRRVLRIWPIYFIVTGVGFLILPALFSLGAIFGLSPEYVQGFAQGTEWYRLPWYIFFVANFDMIVHGPAAFFWRCFGQFQLKNNSIWFGRGYSLKENIKRLLCSVF
jgi:peptidoglycan/LPS O-acetylase OafA/YrhL